MLSVIEIVEPMAPASTSTLHACQGGRVELTLQTVGDWHCLWCRQCSGGVLCGQTMMAAADTAMILAICTQTGSFKPMTTVQLQTSFLRPIPGDAGAARVVARVLRMGRKLVFGEIQILDARGELAAHATTTYALV